MEGTGRFRNLERAYALLPATIATIGIGALIATGAPVEALLHGDLGALSFWQYFSLSVAISGTGYVLSLLLDERGDLKMQRLAEIIRQSKNKFSAERAIITVMLALLIVVVGFGAFYGVLALLAHVLSLFFSGSTLVLATSLSWILVSKIMGLISKGDKADSDSESIGDSNEKGSVAQQLGSQVTSFLNLCITTSVYVTYGFWASVGAGLIAATLLLLPYFIYSCMTGAALSASEGEAAALENDLLDDDELSR